MEDGRSFHLRKSVQARATKPIDAAITMMTVSVVRVILLLLVEALLTEAPALALGWEVSVAVTSMVVVWREVPVWVSVLSSAAVWVGWALVDVLEDDEEDEEEDVEDEEEELELEEELLELKDEELELLDNESVALSEPEVDVAVPEVGSETLPVPVTEALVPVAEAEVAVAESVDATAVGSPSAPTAGSKKDRKGFSAGARFLIMRLSWAWSRGV